MKLPNGELAIVDLRKLHDYCLNSRHPRGRHKARVFASIGIGESDAEELRTTLLTAAATSECKPGEASAYGQRFVVDFDISKQGRTVTIRSTWMVRTGEQAPRLTSCYVL
jgi:hypothetical protein